MSRNAEHLQDELGVSGENLVCELRLQNRENEVGIRPFEFLDAKMNPKSIVGWLFFGCLRSREASPALL